MSNMRQLRAHHCAQAKQTHYELERQTCPSQVEGQTFPSHLKQNKGTGNGIRSLFSRTRWEPQIQIPSRSVHLTFRANSHESSSVVLSISRFSRLAVTRAWIFALVQGAHICLECACVFTLRRFLRGLMPEHQNTIRRDVNLPLLRGLFRWQRSRCALERSGSFSAKAR